MKKLGKMSFIMPAYDIAWRTIERAIDSILDQDYQDWELIIAKNGMVDGGKIRRKVKKYLKDPRIKLLILKKGGACYARNEGAKLATGDFYSFFSSDFILKSGMLRKWLEYFRDNKEYGMIYGGYEWTDDRIPPLQSHEFDQYLLEHGYNFIDGGMPIRKECYVEWDESLVSLNDWEWVINLVKNGCKPLFIPEKAYKADAPKAGGLSNDSANNWLTRLDYIKEKHGINQSNICVSSLGAPFHGIKTAKVLNADFKSFPMGKPHRYDAIYLLGFYTSNADSVRSHMAVFDNTRGSKIKKIIHWIGSDIQTMMGLSWGGNRNIVDAFKREGFIHLCEAGFTKSELAEMGIDAKILPLPLNIDKYRVTKLPKKPTIAIYSPTTHNAEQQYNLALMRDIAESMPDVDFKFYGHGKPMKQDNIEYVGYQTDMPKFIEGCTATLRVTQHDGLPMGPIEFLLSGREAIVSVPGMSGSYCVGDGRIDENVYHQKKEEIIQAIRYTIKNPMSLKDKQLVIQYWREKMSPRRFKEEIDKIVRG